jgi:anti-sigma regulatory factor (Ser/Thr protein kinase)
VIKWAGWQRSEVSASVQNRLMLNTGLHAPAQARAWVSARTPDLPRDATDDALLIVSELVTNAVRHGEGDIVLGLDLRPDRVRIEVRDDGAGLPVVPSEHPPTDRPAGRGLLIVAATAADWGIERTDGDSGKTVWAELRLEAH